MEEAKDQNVKTKVIEVSQESTRGQQQLGKLKMDEAKERDSTLPSMGLMAAGKLSHGSVHVGEG